VHDLLVEDDFHLKKTLVKKPDFSQVREDTFRKLSEAWINADHSYGFLTSSLAEELNFFERRTKEVSPLPIDALEHRQKRATCGGETTHT